MVPELWPLKPKSQGRVYLNRHVFSAVYGIMNTFTQWQFNKKNAFGYRSAVKLPTLQHWAQERKKVITQVGNDHTAVEQNLCVLSSAWYHSAISGHVIFIMNCTEYHIALIMWYSYGTNCTEYHIDNYIRHINDEAKTHSKVMFAKYQTGSNSMLLHRVGGHKGVTVQCWINAPA